MKRINARMSVNEHEHKIFFDKMHIPRFVVRQTDKNAYEVVAANTLALKYFDLSEDQVVDKPIDEFMDDEFTDDVFTDDEFMVDEFINDKFRN